MSNRYFPTAANTVDYNPWGLAIPWETPITFREDFYNYLLLGTSQDFDLEYVGLNSKRGYLAHFDVTYTLDTILINRVIDPWTGNPVAQMYLGKLDINLLLHTGFETADTRAGATYPDEGIMTYLVEENWRNYLAQFSDLTAYDVTIDKLFSITENTGTLYISNVDISSVEIDILANTVVDFTSLPSSYSGFVTYGSEYYASVGQTPTNSKSYLEIYRYDMSTHLLTQVSNFPLDNGEVTFLLDEEEQYLLLLARRNDVDGTDLVDTTLSYTGWTQFLQSDITNFNSYSDITNTLLNLVDEYSKVFFLDFSISTNTYNYLASRDFLIAEIELSSNENTLFRVKDLVITNQSTTPIYFHLVDLDGTVYASTLSSLQDNTEIIEDIVSQIRFHVSDANKLYKLKIYAPLLEADSTHILDYGIYISSFMHSYYTITDIINRIVILPENLNEDGTNLVEYSAIKDLVLMDGVSV